MNAETQKRTALITGSGRNIGRAIALELAAEGYNVILNGSSKNGIREFGRIDVLVNNAAMRPSFDLVNDDEADFQRIMDINFNAALWLTRACLPGMIESGWGRVINFTGMNAQQGYTGKSAVSISKHASWGLVKSIAKEYGKHGVTANIISPGTIVDDVDDAGSEKFETLLRQNPAGRLGEPLDIAKMVGYLTSDHAGFVNGQLVQVNGGVVV